MLEDMRIEEAPEFFFLYMLLVVTSSRSSLLLFSVFYITFMCHFSIFFLETNIKAIKAPWLRLRLTSMYYSFIYNYCRHELY